ncbi:Uncharacterized protein FKW44_017439, partial [Caligus rogercresseyi]
MGRNFGRKNIIKTDVREGRQSYGQHDDRDYNKDNKKQWNGGDGRRVSFKDKSGSGITNRGRRGVNRGGRGGNRGGGRSYIHPGRLGGSSSAPPGRIHWTKVVFLNMGAHDKVEFLRGLRNQTNQKISPVHYAKQGPHFIFYVHSKEEIQALRNAEKSFAPGLSMRLENQPPPDTHLTQTVTEKLTEIMSSRYNTNTKALDLKTFHLDKSFLGEPLFTPLYRTNVLSTITKTIVQYIPEMEAMDISHNRIRMLDPFIDLVPKTPNVKILHLNNNM